MKVKYHLWKGLKKIKKIDPKHLMLPTFLSILILIYVTRVSNSRNEESNFNDYRQESVQDIETNDTNNEEEIPWSKIETNISYAYNPLTESYEIVNQNAVIYYFVKEKGIYEHIVKDKTDTLIIPIQENESMVYSISPKLNYIIYNIGRRNDDVLIETPVFLHELMHHTEKAIFEFPEDKTFAGVMTWEKDENYFYYRLRSASKNLHFPDPETTEFYKYDISTTNSTFLNTASEFYDSSSVHTLIRGESSDRNYYYVTSIGHGDPGLINYWKVRRSSGEKELIFESEDKSTFHYLSNQDFDNDEIVVVETNSSGNNNNQHNVFVLDIETKQRKDLTEIEGNAYSYILTNNKYYADTKNSGKEIFIYQKNSAALEYSIKPLENTDKRVNAIKTESDDKIAFSINDIDNVIGVLDIKSKDINYYEIYDLPGRVIGIDHGD